MDSFANKVVIGGVMLLGFFIVLNTIDSVIAGIIFSIALGVLSWMLGPTVGKIIQEYFSRKKDKTRWFREELARPLLDEVSEAANGNLPGKPGEYQSKWTTELDEATRQRDTEIRDLFEEYTNYLKQANTCVDQQYRIAPTFINDLPGGRFGPPSYIIGDVMTTGNHRHQSETQAVATGPAMAPEPEGEEVIFKDWIQDIWPAFEEAGSATEFKSELQSQYHSLPYDNEVFSYWEVQEGDPNWEDTFWDYYENDVIEEYYGAAMEREEYEEKAMNLADTIEEIMQAEIRKRYG